MPNPAPEPIDTRQIVAILHRGWTVVAVVAGVAAVVALAWSLIHTPMYRASTVVSLNPVVGMDSVAGGSVSSGAVQSQIDLITAGSTAELVAARIGTPVDATATRASAETTNISISATSNDADRAALIADTYAEVYAELRCDDVPVYDV
jgi:uncharacterized protein involved in exopolysaccharide biosynthesis